MREFVLAFFGEGQNRLDHVMVRIIFKTKFQNIGKLPSLIKLM